MPKLYDAYGKQIKEPPKFITPDWVTKDAIASFRRSVALFVEFKIDDLRRSVEQS